MTKQEAFDKMVAHLAAQKQRCVDQAMCLYRGPRGRKCVVGALISDETYATLKEKGCELNDITVIWRYVRKELALSGSRKSPLYFYADMQGAHDSCLDVKNLKVALHTIAIDHGLNSASVSTITEWK